MRIFFFDAMKPVVKRPWEVGKGQEVARRYRVPVNYPCALTVRLTKAERERIFEDAAEAGLSVSRFVARTLVSGRYPPSLLDREELFRLRCLLEAACIHLQQIARQWRTSAPVDFSASFLTEIRSAAQTLRALSREAFRKME